MTKKTGPDLPALPNLGDNIITDLAPGDFRSSTFDWKPFDKVRITSVGDLLFELVFSELWKEFGAKGEIEPKEILEQRMHWGSVVSPARVQQRVQEKVQERIHDGYSFSYELIAVLREQKFVAARDHSVIIRMGQKDKDQGNNKNKGSAKGNLPQSPQAVVHLSHALIDPKYRGSGMAAWLRTWPIQSARAALRAVGLPETCAITLVAEMEPLEPGSISHLARLKSYQRGGFLMVDPSKVSYLQPDFRVPEAIDSSGGPKPLPLRLLIRRIGHETEREIKGSDLRETVSALYHMFGSTFRAQDMRVLWDQLRSDYPPDDAIIRLLDPTQEVLA